MDQFYCEATGLPELPKEDFVIPVIAGINKGMWLYRAHAEDGRPAVTGWAKTQAEGRAEINAKHSSTKRFWDEKVCWLEAGDRTPDGGIVLRVKGEHYVTHRLGGSGRSDSCKGHGGRLFHWRVFGDDMVRTSDDVWFQGTIPRSHRDALPDNAEWVSSEPAGADPLEEFAAESHK